jgi:hypothetical protein
MDETHVNAIQFRKMFVKYLNKICSVCEGHIRSMNFPPRYMGGKLCLVLKGGRQIMPTYRCKNPLTIEE